MGENFKKIRKNLFRIPISRFRRKLKKSDLNCEQIVNKTLLEMSNGVDLYRQFLTLHQNQLQTSVVPEHLWPTLFKKLVEGVFDAGSTFSLMQVEEEEETSWKVVVISEEGVNCGD